MGAPGVSTPLTLIPAAQRLAIYTCHRHNTPNTDPGFADCCPPQKDGFAASQGNLCGPATSLLSDASSRPRAECMHLLQAMRFYIRMYDMSSDVNGCRNGQALSHTDQFTPGMRWHLRRDVTESVRTMSLRLNDMDTHMFSSVTMGLAMFSCEAASTTPLCYHCRRGVVCLAGRLAVLHRTYAGEIQILWRSG